jgi:methionyl-tRNA formyltransferase
MGFLKNLINSKYEISFVTSKSKPVLHVLNLENDLKKVCNKNKIEYLGNTDTSMSNIIKKASKVDLCILGGYDKILKKEILSAPKYGFINTHLGIIPQNRGCNPSMWAILNNIQQGATTYVVNEKIDQGSIIDIQYLDDNTLNSYEAYQALSKKASDNIISCIEKIEREDPFLDIDGKERYHRSGMPNGGYVSWSWCLDFIKKFSDSMIFPPYRPMSSVYDGIIVHLVCDHIEKIDLPGLKNGTIMKKSGKQIQIKAHNGIAYCTLFKEYNIKIADVFSYRRGASHIIDETFSKPFID